MIGADDVDEQPDPPAFQLFMNHHKGANNTHDRRERVEVRKRAGLAEQHRKPDMQVLCKRA